MTAPTEPRPPAPAVPRSEVRGIVWPALPDARTATLLAVVWQLEQSQWWSPAELARRQHSQLGPLLHHAATTTLHYRDSFAAAGATPADARFAAATWARVPEISRTQLIDAGARLLSQQYPAGHGGVDEVSTSRTSGEPVRLRSTEVISTFWKAITLREHQWHGRDLGARLAAIRHVAGGGAAPPDGTRGRGWGPATAGLAPEAPLSLLSVASTTEQQLAWLLREDPAYLIVYPTVLDALLTRLAERGARLPALRQVRTISEALPEGLRARCQAILGVPLVDTYSAQEVGYLALQCPSHAGYHVQAERVLVEILDDAGRPCGPGETGRVVVTDLHNFATPVIRYDLGDYAEVGAPCPCGRGLPVLTRIVGRRRGMLVYPDGRTMWPVFTVACREAARYRELQLVQESVTTLRLRVVPVDAGLGDADRAALTRALRTCLSHDFTVIVETVDALGRSPAGKLEEFVSHVAR